MWIDSKQLDSDGQLKPCTTPQCGGFSLEAKLGIAKNSSGEPDFLGWEVKQFAVEDFERIESAKPITMMTPEPDGGFYKDADVESFIRKFGYADKNDKPDRLNFGGRHVVGQRCPPTGLTMQLAGFDAAKGKITDANGEEDFGTSPRPSPRSRRRGWSVMRSLCSFAANESVSTLVHLWLKTNG